MLNSERTDERKIDMSTVTHHSFSMSNCYCNRSLHMKKFYKIALTYFSMISFASDLISQQQHVMYD